MAGLSPLGSFPASLSEELLGQEECKVFAFTVGLTCPAFKKRFLQLSRHHKYPVFQHNIQLPLHRGIFITDVAAYATYEADNSMENSIHHCMTLNTSSLHTDGESLGKV